MKKIIFGFDLGIASIGWAIIEFDDENIDFETGEIFDEGRIIACGVRCFSQAENLKDGSSLAADRRIKRLARRLIRRKAKRMLDIKRMFIVKGLISSRKELDNVYAQQTGGDVWNLRVKALTEPLSTEELLRVLTHLAKHRGFKSYRKSVEEADKESGILLRAIRENESQLSDYQTMAQMIVERSLTSEDHKKRNFTPKNGENKGNAVYVNSIPRAEIIRETELIFDRQKQYGIFTQDLFDDFKKIAFRYKDAGSIAHMVGKCRFEPYECRAPKESPSAELFVAMSKINNMQLAVDGELRFLNEDERKALLDLLKNTKEVKYSTIKNKLFKNREVWFSDINYSKTSKKDKAGNEKEVNPLDVKFYSMKGWHELKSKFSPEEWDDVSNNIELLDIGMTAVASEKNDENIEKYLQTKGIDKKYWDVFKSLTSSKFINLSLKALYKINPFLAEGLKYHEACEKAGYDYQADGTSWCVEKGEFLPPIPEDKKTTVPVVNRAVAQFRKVYNAMVRSYGKPDQINLEVGRDLKKNYNERQEIKKKQDENECERKEAERTLESYVLTTNAKNILKLRLYNQQQGKCIYSETPIDIRRLEENGYCDIDHIIPYSRSLDDSQNNKVLCLSSENSMKGNKTPFEYLEPLGRWDKFETIVNTTPSINGRKRKNLLDKTYKDREKDIEFKERNANDSSHIARYVKQYLEGTIDFSSSPHQEIKNRIQVRTGSLTDYLRHQWGLKKERDANDKHHAQDAIVIACTTQSMVQKLSRLSAIFENKDEFRKRKAEELGQEKAEAWYKYIKTQISKPWDGFREETLAMLENVFVSRPPHKRATGELHGAKIRTLNPKHKNYSAKDVKSGMLVRGGLANNGNMLRTDVFVKKNQKGKDEFYLVPVYLSNMGKTLPNKAIVAHKDEKDWIEMDDSYQFKFSIYIDDLVRVKKGEKNIFGYFKGTDRSNASVTIEVHDGSSSMSSIGVKSQDTIQKYQVDYLGRITEIKSETRVPLTLLGKKRAKKAQKREN